MAIGGLANQDRDMVHGVWCSRHNESDSSRMNAWGISFVPDGTRTMYIIVFPALKRWAIIGYVGYLGAVETTTVRLSVTQWERN